MPTSSIFKDMSLTKKIDLFKKWIDDLKAGDISSLYLLGDWFFSIQHNSLEHQASEFKELIKNSTKSLIEYCKTPENENNPNALLIHAFILDLSWMAFSLPYQSPDKREENIRTLFDQAIQLGSVDALYFKGRRSELKVLSEKATHLLPSLTIESAGTSEAFKETIALYEAAITLDNTYAMYNLGNLLIKSDDKKAARLFRKAADKGHDMAKQFLSNYVNTQTGKPSLFSCKSSTNIFAYHSLMNEDNIERAAQLVFQDSKLLKEFIDYDCSQRLREDNTINSNLLSIEDFFKKYIQLNNKEKYKLSIAIINSLQNCIDKGVTMAKWIDFKKYCLAQMEMDNIPNEDAPEIIEIAIHTWIDISNKGWHEEVLQFTKTVTKILIRGIESLFLLETELRYKHLLSSIALILGKNAMGESFNLSAEEVDINLIKVLIAVNGNKDILKHPCLKSFIEPAPPLLTREEIEEEIQSTEQIINQLPTYNSDSPSAKEEVQYKKKSTEKIIESQPSKLPTCNPDRPSDKEDSKHRNKLFSKKLKPNTPNQQKEDTLASFFSGSSPR